MIIGVPKEIKDEEHRVGLTPASVREAVDHGHRVLVETDAATAIGFGDGDYVAAGAEVIPQADEIFDTAEMIVKVKEPQPAELPWLRDGQVIFTYLHLAALSLTRSSARPGRRQKKPHGTAYGASII